MAETMLGCAAILTSPPTARITNQIRMIGPNADAMRAVPWLCTANSPIRIARLMISTNGSNIGVTRLRPSTAESTEIAGVIIASPKNSAAPAMPSSGMRRPRSPTACCASAIRLNVPPSPWLSARSMISTYFNVTITTKAHSISEITPNTMSAVSVPPPRAAVRDSLTA